MGKPKFEESWRNYFDGAESDVPDSLWSKIEVDLVRAENKGQRKSLVFYRRLAAGIALIAGALATYITYDQLNQEEATYALSEETAPRPADGRQSENGDIQEPTKGENSSNERSPLNNTLAIDNTMRQKSLLKQSITSSQKSSAASLPLFGVVESNNSSMPQEEKYRRRLGDYRPDIPESEIKIRSEEFFEPNFPRRLPAMPSYFVASNNKDDERQSENLWAALGFAGGSYSPGGGSGSYASQSAKNAVNQLSFSNATPQSEQAKLGVAYSGGVMVGKEISPKWVLQGGIGFLSQQIDYTSNYIASNTFSGAVQDNSLEALVTEYDAPLNNVYLTSPYTIRSASEYISIPVQAGYKVIDKKFGLQVNAGLASDLFLKNKLTDESGQSESFSQSAGSQSPYRSVNWTGLMGIELSHKIANHYRLAVVPGVRYSLTSIVKDDVGLAKKPLVLDLGMRVKYIFN